MQLACTHTHTHMELSSLCCLHELLACKSAQHTLSEGYSGFQQRTLLQQWHTHKNNHKYVTSVTIRSVCPGSPQTSGHVMQHALTDFLQQPDPCGDALSCHGSQDRITALLNIAWQPLPIAGQQYYFSAICALVLDCCRLAHRSCCLDRSTWQANIWAQRTLVSCKTGRPLHL